VTALLTAESASSRRAPGTGVYRVNIVTNTARPEPVPRSDQLTQAVTVALCLALAAVLLVLALVP